VPRRADERVDVAIIGGGLAGLSCALALAGSGLSVTVFERSDTLGGRAGSRSDAASGDVIDIGPHIVLSEYRNMLDMLESLGSSQDILWQTDQFVTLLDASGRVPMRLTPLPAPLHLLPSLLKVKNLGLHDKLSNLRMTWLAMRAGEADFIKFDHLNAVQLLDHCGVSRKLRNWFWATATLALLNVPLHECSAAALLRMYAQLIGTSSYRSGFARRPLADLFAPQIHAKVLAEGGRIELNSEVVSLCASDGGISRLQLADGHRIAVGTCVAAIPPQDLHRLVRTSGLADTRVWRNLAMFEPCPYISTYLWFDRKLTQERFWGRIWSADNLNCDFYDLSNIRGDIDPRRSLIASNCIYSKPYHALTDTEIAARTWRELSEFAPSAGAARLLHAVVHRIPMAIPCPHPGTEALRPSTTTPLKGLLIAGDWTGTGLPACMESATYSGRLAAQHILHAHRRALAPALPPAQGDGIVRLARKLWPVRDAPEPRTGVARAAIARMRRKSLDGNKSA
jgi:squalene-associated FAD-dependent desaturase